MLRTRRLQPGLQLPLRLTALLLITSCSGEVIEGTSLGLDASSSSEVTGTGSSSGTTDEPGTTGTTGEPTTGAGTSTTTGTSSSTTGAGVCGDGVQDPGEDCDDGDLDDTDDCTIQCAPPTCTDKLQSGSESDLDCGGSCPGCGGGLECTVDADCAAELCDMGKCLPLGASCLELLTMAPGLPDGDYNIDPEQSGSLLLVSCDMANGGWTYLPEAQKDPLGSWSGGTVSVCGGLGQSLGVGQFGAKIEPTRSFTLLKIPHSEARVLAGIVVIDSWDSEKIILELDGQEAASQTCQFNNPNTCNQQKNECGQGGFPDGRIDLVGARAHQGDALAVKLRTTLDEDLNNESWALDALRLALK